MEPFSSISNPFSAAAVSGGRLPYLFAEPSVEKNLLQSLDRHQWIGQVVGPHGSGKTTLTHHLWRQAKDRFPKMVQVTIRGRNKIQRRAIGEGSPCLFVVDGIERLSRVDRWLFLRGFSIDTSGSLVASRVAEVVKTFEAFGQSKLLTSSATQGNEHRGRPGQGDGLLVTGHRPLPWLPMLFETSFDEVLLNRLTNELLPKPIRTGIPGGDDDVFSGRQWKEFSCSLLQQHGNNCREIFMEMYDLYEANYREKHRSKKLLHLSKVGVEN